jgi:hypothetical protein
MVFFIDPGTVGIKTNANLSGGKEGAGDLRRRVKSDFVKFITKSGEKKTQPTELPSKRPPRGSLTCPLYRLRSKSGLAKVCG